MKAIAKGRAHAFMDGVPRNDMTFDEHGVACGSDKHADKHKEV